MTPPIEISVLLPTRGRPGRAAGMLRSLAESATDPGTIEIVLLVDRDDPASHSIDTAGLRTKRIVHRRTTMGVMTDVCYRASRGRHVMLANDDIVFRTPGWDTTVLEALTQHDDGVVLVWGNDDFTGGPTHPFLPRTLCELMGGVCPTAYDRLFIDVHIYSIFRKLKSLGHDRMRFLPDVLFDHIHADAGKEDVDATFVKTHGRSDEILYIHYDDERRIIADELRRHIDSQTRAGAKHSSNQLNGVRKAA